MKETKKEKVLVALSGGVASSLTASLLKKQGYQVVGVHFHLGSTIHPQKPLSGQTKFLTPEDLEKKLGIQVQVVDLSDKVDSTVLNLIEEEILFGWRPQIAAHLHHRVLFPELFSLMKTYGAHKVATGHVTQIFVDPMTNNAEVHEASDVTMDQSTLLLGLSKEQLSLLLVPFGGFSKNMVSKLSREFAMDPDAQVLECKIPGEGRWFQDAELRTFVRSRIAPDLSRAGSIQAQVGVMGSHSGIIHMSPGEFYEVSKEQQGDSQKDFSDWIVLSLNHVQKQALVGPAKEHVVSSIELKNFQNWAVPAVHVPQVFDIRYRNDVKGFPKAMVTLFEGNTARLDIPGSLSDVFLGQFVLLEKAGNIVGGGQIRRLE